MDIMQDNSGNLLVGEIVNDAFVVQSGPDFDATFEVYAMDEVTPAVDPLLAAVVEDAVDYPSELDNEVSDYQAVVAGDAERERVEIESFTAQFLAAAQAYVDSVDRLQEAVDRACSGEW